MKEFFQKLLTEQERAGSSMPSAKWGRRVKPEPDSEYENEIGGFVPWSRHRNQDNKSLTDVLSPLRGYLRKNIGRPWNEVYSEICWGMDKRSTTGAHIFTHLWQYVERNTWMGEDGKVYYWSGGGGRPSRVDEWYVHPRTGILCYERNYRRYRKPERDEPNISGEIEIEVGKSYERIKGIWYYTEWYMADKFVGYHPTWIQFGRNPWQTEEEKVILKKKQLNGQQLRGLGVYNLRSM
jgi:hypothetical protein